LDLYLIDTKTKWRIEPRGLLKERGISIRLLVENWTDKMVPFIPTDEVAECGRLRSSRQHAERIDYEV
jgi:hypothetical protein